MTWQPIETAPRVDDEDVLLWVAGGVAIGYWDGSTWCSLDESVAGMYGVLYNKPTHWMPLPEPPK